MPIASVLHILRMIKNRGPLSRTDLQQMTALSWGTITNTTRELLNRKFIREQGALSTKAGRKPVQLALSSATHTLLGVEIAAGKIAAILIQLGGEILWHESATFSPEQSPDAVLSIATHLVRRGQQAAEQRPPLGVGLVLPAPIDPVRGTVRPSAHMPAWNNFPVRERFESRVQLPVHLEQHANALALAHQWFDPTAAVEAENFICIHLGETVELGIVNNGDIYRGHAGMAGNFAHVTLDTQGPACDCGNRGCVDLLCSSRGLLAAAPPDAAAPRSMADITARAAAGDASARAAFERLGTHLGMGIAMLAHLFDPAAFVLTGPTSAGASFFLAAMEQHLQTRRIKTRILVSTLDQNAPALGVCALIIQNTLQADASPAHPAPSAESLSA